MSLHLNNASTNSDKIVSDITDETMLAIYSIVVNGGKQQYSLKQSGSIVALHRRLVDSHGGCDFNSQAKMNRSNL